MSYYREPRHTHEEWQRYAPVQYRRSETVFSILKYLGFILVVGVSYFAGKEGNVSLWFGWGLGSTFAASLIAGFTLRYYEIKLDDLVDEALRKERDALQTKVAKMEDDIKGVAAKIKAIKAKGNVVVAGGGNTVIISSAITNSLNTIKHDDPGLADALATISGAVENSGNKEAGEAWQSFMKQATGEKDKTVMSALWDKVVKLVPDIASLAESAAKIAPLLIGP